MTRTLTGERLFIGGIFLAATLADIPRSFNLFGMSGLALLSIAFLVVGGLSLLAVPPHFTEGRVVRPFILFFAWVVITAMIHPPTGPGFQNLTILSVFVVTMLVTAGEAARDPSLPSKVIGYGRALVLASSALYLVSAVIGKISSSSFIGQRTYALAALIGLACLLAEGDGERKAVRGRALMVIGVIGMSLSRLALALALGLLFIARSTRRPSRRRVLRLIVSVAFAGLVMVLIVSHVPALKERFFSGDQSIAVGSLRINASGRWKFWTATVESWQQSPWVGHGAGSASQLIDSLFPGLGHPHNEFLRLLHDFGIVGLGLWVWGLVGLLRHSWRRWHTSSGGTRAIHQATALGVMALLAMMLTDNPLAYLFVLGPLGALAGASLGARVVPAAEDAADAAAEPADEPAGPGGRALAPLSGRR